MPGSAADSGDDASLGVSASPPPRGKSMTLVRKLGKKSIRVSAQPDILDDQSVGFEVYDPSTCRVRTKGLASNPS
jgi:hypothetical protein